MSRPAPSPAGRPFVKGGGGWGAVDGVGAGHSAGVRRAWSISATAMPSRKTTFSGHTSLWHTSVPPAGSARLSSQARP
jgi:hypothetical protein